MWIASQHVPKTRTMCIFLAWQVEVLHLWLFIVDDSQSTGAMAYLQAIFRPSNPSFVNWIHHRRGKAMVSLLKNDLDSWWVKPTSKQVQEANYQSQYITSSIVVGLMACRIAKNNHHEFVISIYMVTSLQSKVYRRLTSFIITGFATQSSGLSIGEKKLPQIHWLVVTYPSEK